MTPRRSPAPTVPRATLMSLPAGVRVLGAALLLVPLWLAILWALGSGR